VFYDTLINMGAPPFIAAIEKPFVNVYVGSKYGFDKLKINPLDEIEKLNGRPALIAHSKGDSQVPFASFERLIDKVGEENVQVFTRDGDEHFICYDAYFENPIEDVEFSTAILTFLDGSFTGRESQ